MSALLAHSLTEMQTSKIMLPLAGVWLRKFEEDPLGDAAGADRSTLVVWIQSGSSGIYVDIRLPVGSPGRSIGDAQEAGIVPRPDAIAATGLSDAAKKQLLKQDGINDVILRQKSFAGILDFKEGDTTRSGEAIRKDELLATLAAERENDSKGLSLCTCFWRRDIDYWPPSGALDIGVCASEPMATDGSVLLRETGDDASYAECWERAPDCFKGPFMALELVKEVGGAAGHRVGYWVRSGDRFAYAVGRPTASEAHSAVGSCQGSHTISSCVGKTLAEAVSSITKEPCEMLDIAGCYVCVCGEINAAREWIIQHSTNPELVGCLLVGNLNTASLCCSQLQHSKSGDEEAEQVLADGSMRCWKVVELSGCTLPI